MIDVLPVERFLATLRIVQRESEHLAYSWRGLFDASPTIDAVWVETLDDDPGRMLFDAYNRIRAYAEQRMGIETDRLPLPAARPGESDSSAPPGDQAGIS